MWTGVTYGLTELRFYATAMLLLLGVVLVWFTWTVLRERHEAFALGTLITAAVTAVVLFVANPDALIARTNLSRMHTEIEGIARFDVVYATSLSADAVPVLLEALPTLPPDARCRIADRLLRRWPPGVRAALRTWNWSDARARRLVQERAESLVELATCR